MKYVSEAFQRWKDRASSCKGVAQFHCKDDREIVRMRLLNGRGRVRKCQAIRDRVTPSSEWSCIFTVESRR